MLCHYKHWIKVAAVMSVSIGLPIYSISVFKDPPPPSPIGLAYFPSI